jgi:hypothetical protein
MLERLTENEKALALAEIAPLRDEVNRAVDRMTTNEVLCTTFVLAIIVFQLTYQFQDYAFNLFISTSGSIIALAVAWLGCQRSGVFRRHLNQVDDYLEELELKFSEHGGWTSHYRRELHTKEIKTQAGTRNLLWHVLRYGTLLNFLVQLYAAANSFTFYLVNP